MIGILNNSYALVLSMRTIVKWTAVMLRIQHIAILYMVYDLEHVTRLTLLTNASGHR